ncbi:MAG: hypothetical protein CMK32_08760, partial [Porticoccaceae bacterium]|nr:hypothetical protein [Porticoccaceae bacterium]
QQPAFQRDGKFDPDMYRYALGRLGFTPKTYRQRVEEELLAGQFTGGVLASGFVTGPEFERLVALTLQERDLHYLRLARSTFADAVEINDGEVETYYQQQNDQFQVPEQIRVAFIEVTPEGLGESIAVDEEAIRQRYEEESATYQSQTQWEVAHIQIDDQSEVEAKKTIATIQARLADGDTFESLAREFSTDAGSAQQGGILGVVSPGALPEAMEDVIETLAVGEVSEPVSTESGLHLIKVLDKTVSNPPDFEAERERIAADLKREKAMDALPRVVETLKEKAFNVDSLASVAEDMALPLQTSEPFGREGGAGILANPAVVEAAFSNEVLEHEYASEVLELGEQHFLVLKLLERIPAHKQPLEAVRDAIVSRLRSRKSQEQISEQASALVKQVRSGASIESVAVESGYPWQVVTNVTRFQSNLDPALAEAAFSHSSAIKLPVAGLIELSDGDYAVYTVDRIHTGDPSKLTDQELEGLRKSLGQLIASREWQSYEAALLAGADIER